MKIASRSLTGMVFGLLLFATAVTLNAQSGGLRATTSLGIVPQDVAIYTSMLRSGEQVDRILKSRAVAKLRSLPVVQMGLAKLQSEWQSGDISKLREFLELPENRQLVPLLTDAVSHEVFLVGEGRLGAWFATFNQFNNTINMARFQASLSGEDPDEAVANRIVELLSQQPDLKKIPTVMLGFRLDSPAVASQELERLEKLLQAVIDEEAPQLKGRLRRDRAEGRDLLTMQLDGSVVPWDEVLEDLDEELRDKLKPQLIDMKAVVHLGLWRNYLLLYVGENSQLLERLGQGPLLVEHADMAPLLKYQDRPVTSVGYFSGQFATQASAFDQQMEQFRKMAETVIPLAPAADEIKTELKEDVAKMTKELSALQPARGSMAAITYEVDGGYESWAYDQTKYDGQSDVKPLDILQHVGGTPIGFLAGRNGSQPAAEAFCHRWAMRVGYYIDKMVLPSLDDEKRQEFDKWKNELLPLGQRLISAYTTKLKPGLADGQFAFVLGAEQKNKRWHMAMPPAAEPLPFPEACLVLGVSDAGLVEAGGAEVFSVVDDLVKKLHKLNPSQVPNVVVPPPMLRQSADGKVYSYDIALLVGLDGAIAPNAVLGEKYLAFSLLPTASQRMVRSIPLQAEQPLSGDLSKPLVLAWQFKMHELVNMVRPWVRYGFDVARKEKEVPQQISDQVLTVLDVLQSIRTSNGVAFIEGKSLVSHTRTQFVDLAP